MAVLRGCQLTSRSPLEQLVASSPFSSISNADRLCLVDDKRTVSTRAAALTAGYNPGTTPNDPYFLIPYSADDDQWERLVHDLFFGAMQHMAGGM